jgi:hypothetical protein
MTTITAKIMDSVQNESRIVALTDCLHTWDGNISEDVIVQGIMARYAALGTPLQGLRLSRPSLTNVKVIGLSQEGKTFTVLSFRVNEHKYSFTGTVEQEYGTKVLCATSSCEDYFHKEEISKMGVWLLENFHH